MTSTLFPRQALERGEKLRPKAFRMHPQGLLYQDAPIAKASVEKKKINLIRREWMEKRKHTVGVRAQMLCM